MIHHRMEVVMMNKDLVTTAKKQGFFSLNLNLINDLVTEDGVGADELMAFIVLNRGTMKGNAISTHGAMSIAERTGMTNYMANEVLRTLSNRGYIHTPEIVEGYASKRTPRWGIRVSPNPDPVALANYLVDGIGRGKGHPPLSRIRHDVKSAKNGSTAEARLDTLMVLLYLHKYHSIADFGGVDPRSGVYCNWHSAENSNGNEVEVIDDVYSLFEITGDNMQYRREFSEEALIYVKDEGERKIRFLNAFENLRRFGILYEVTQIWTDDPLKNRSAEPLYTLYVHDRHARNEDPYLSTQIHSAMFKSGQLDPKHEFSSHENQRIENNLGTGQFRFVANTKTGGFPIGIYRLRFRPGTIDTGKGMDAEQRRVDHWSEILRSLNV